MDQIAFITAEKAEIQFGDKLPAGARQVDGWRFLTPLDVLVISSELAGASVLEIATAKPAKPAKPAKG
jgi:hypothetical protein